MSEYLFETPSPIGLRVELDRGAVHVAAEDTTRTRVLVEGEGADLVVVTHGGGRVTVDATRQRTGLLGGRPELHVTVTVPTDSDIDVRAGSADLTVDGAVGAVRLRTGSGDVRVSTANGPAVLESGSGGLGIDDALGALRVKSGSGEVRIGRARSSAVVSTGSGDVAIGSAAGPAAVKTGSGDVALEQALGDVSLTTGSGDLVVGAARRGRLTANGGSGDVRIGVPAGLPVWTDITTGAGEIRSDLVGAGPPAEGAEHLEIRARSASGDIDLRQL